MKTQELKSILSDYSINEIEKAYMEFNPSFNDPALYDIPKTLDEWVTQIIVDINEN